MTTTIKEATTTGINRVITSITNLVNYVDSLDGAVNNANCSNWHVNITIQETDVDVYKVDEALWRLTDEFYKAKDETCETIARIIADKLELTAYTLMAEVSQSLAQQNQPFSFLDEIFENVWNDIEKKFDSLIPEVQWSLNDSDTELTIKF